MNNERETLKALNGATVYACGKIVDTSKHRICMTHLVVLNIFINKLFLIPAPIHFVHYASEDHMLIDKKIVPDNIGESDYITFIGTVKKYKRKDNTLDYSIEDIKYIKKIINIDEFREIDAKHIFCQYRCKHWNECNKALLNITSEIHEKSDDIISINNGYAFIPIFNTEICHLSLMGKIERANEIDSIIIASLIIDKKDNEYQVEFHKSLPVEEENKIMEKVLNDCKNSDILFRAFITGNKGTVKYPDKQFIEKYYKEF